MVSPSPGYQGMVHKELAEGGYNEHAITFYTRIAGSMSKPPRRGLSDRKAPDGGY
ncbi:hypothetical protein JCM12294_05660 [Desulfocicer niacini]